MTPFSGILKLGAIVNNGRDVAAGLVDSEFQRVGRVGVDRVGTAVVGNAKGRIGHPSPQDGRRKKECLGQHGKSDCRSRLTTISEASVELKSFS